MKRTTRLTVLCVLLIALGSNIARAQQDEKDKKNNDPYHIRPLKVQLLMLTMDGFNFGCGLQADYHFKHAVVEAQWRKAFYWTIGGIPDPGDTKNATTNSLHSFSNYEADGEYYFADYLVEKKFKNILSQNSYSYTYNYGYGKVRRIFAVKAGVFVSSGFVATDSAAHFNTNYTTTGFAAGISRKRIDKVKSSRHHDGVRETYLQILDGTTSLETMKLKPNQGATPATAFKNIGWRLGGQRYGEHLYVGWEMGERPGLVNPDKGKAGIPFNYFLISFGITIYGNEKWK